VADATMRRVAVPAGLRRAWEYIGYRGRFLIIAGSANFGYGLALVTAVYHKTLFWPVTEAALDPYHHLFGVPFRLWGYAWMFTGLYLVAGSAFPRYSRFFFAWSALVGMCWALLSLNWYLTAVPKQPGGYGPAAIYMGCALAVLLVSGWPEPPRKPDDPMRWMGEGEE
jgi:hypothetical protein